jgi:predicted transposase YbfD/YdcC
VDKGHGRCEVRSIRTTTILTKGQEWEGLKQGFEVTRERTEKGGTTVEVVYGITSLAPEQADAERLLALVRGHWGIENGLHYRRDVTLGEDASRVRKGAAPQVMAALRNALIHLVQPLNEPSLAAAIRKCANCFPQALMLLGLPPIE